MLVESTPPPRGQFHRRVYPQLLPAQIPKVQKVSQVKHLFGLLGSAHLKAVRKHIDEIDPADAHALLSMFGGGLMEISICLNERRLWLLF